MNIKNQWMNRGALILSSLMVFACADQNRPANETELKERDLSELELSSTQQDLLDAETNALPNAVVSRIRLDDQGNIANGAKEEIRYINGDVPSDSAMVAMFDQPQSLNIESPTSKTLGQSSFNHIGQHPYGYQDPSIYGNMQYIYPYYGNRRLGGVYQKEKRESYFRESYYPSANQWRGGCVYNGNRRHWDRGMSFIPSRHHHGGFGGQVVYPYGTEEQFESGNYAYSLRRPAWN